MGSLLLLFYLYGFALITVCEIMGNAYSDTMGEINQIIRFTSVQRAFTVIYNLLSPVLALSR